MAASGVSRILRVGRLDAPASVPPLTRPPSPGSFASRFSSREAVAVPASGNPFTAESGYDEAIARSVERQHSTRRPSTQQALAHGVAHELFDGIAHRTSTEFRMKSLSYEERQNG